MKICREKVTVGIFLAAISIFIWGITFVATKHLLAHFSSLEILIIRFLLAYIMLWIMYPKKLALKNARHEGYFAIAGLFGVTLYQFMENIAIEYTSASNVSIIVSICPIFTAIASQIFFKEKHITPKFIIGFIMAIVGVALVSFNGSAKLDWSPKGDLLALGSALSWTGYSLAISKINAHGYPSIASTRKVFGYALLFMLPIVAYSLIKSCPSDAIFGINFLPKANILRFSKFSNWMPLAFLGIGASCLCFVAWGKACKIIGTVKATVGLYLIPVVTIVFAFFILHEEITLMGSIGAVLTITGLFLSAK